LLDGDHCGKPDAEIRVAKKCDGKNVENKEQLMELQVYKEKILDEFICRFQNNPNSLPDAYALIWSIDVYASLVWSKTGKEKEEKCFKNDLDKQCEEFKIIRSASNAIKHIERDRENVFVKSMTDIAEGEGSSFHAWFNGVPSASISINMYWNHNPDTNEYTYGKGPDRVELPKNKWKTQYLWNLYGPAIAAIDHKLEHSED
jgi:hypothetical protein